MTHVWVVREHIGDITTLRGAFTTEAAADRYVDLAIAATNQRLAVPISRFAFDIDEVEVDPPIPR